MASTRRRASSILLTAAAARLVLACSAGAAPTTAAAPGTADAGAPDVAATEAATTGSDEASEGGVQPASTEHTVSIGVGYATACALSDQGHVKCWGDAVDGELLTPPQPGAKCYLYGDDENIDCDPRGVTTLAIPDPVVELSVGYLNVCVIANHEGAKRLGCWGKNDRYSLSAAAPLSAVVSSIVWISLPSPPKHVAQGRNFKLVTLEDGTVWGWGDNRYGQFGGATLDEIGQPQQVFPLAGVAGPTVRGVAASYLDSFILTSEGLFGVGDNTSSQLMESAHLVEERHAFTKLPDPVGGGAVDRLFTSAGYGVGQCYVTANGRASCWGDNDHGQVGSAAFALVTSVVDATPVDLPSDRTVRTIAVGSGQTCAVTDDGAVHCWGENDRGESGSAVLGDLYAPVRVTGLGPARQVVAGRAAFTCALTEDAKTFCWGDSSFGQLGAAPAAGGGWSASPVEVRVVW